mmetsp:Transcript_20693/g.44936  ORF Transcript_20693/g.44936 Transcript_20693/m.44936 type:complete len:806 (+) Transcript_20693:151-2568(+)|eukprot:CAMPEP_0172319348 /NCGR_PEP_ID=MMETSP1058-20130122/37397_1 /TAXON_ID=83371 /ORGANISM="Detonula confervacea, Strain CCMP 353" /LENGTH=805 /DNA_ID=CAMNT_0013034365 /DNA_START=48 /DNA_END=2465 /DNA_ORIENTATION=-
MTPNNLALVLAIIAASIEYGIGFTSCPRSVPPSSTLFAATKDTSKEDVLKEGRLVEFSSGTGANKQISLGAIIGKEGKKNLKILTSSGRTSSVPLRSVKHMVPNGRAMSTETQIEQHENAAATALESDVAANGQSVAEVWEMLLEDCNDDESCQVGVDLITLSELILGDSTSTSCYATRAMLTEGVESYCFKEIGGNKFDDSGGPMYEPRQMEVVENLRSIAKVEAQEAAKWDELKQRMYDASNNKSFVVEDETEEIQTALKALQQLGCLANLSPDEIKREEKAALGNKNDAEVMAIAKLFLQNIDRRATPEVARQLLVSLGVWTKHSNLDLVRLKVRTTFDQYFEDAAVDIASNPPLDLDEGSRLDLTHLPAFAIDEASTKEIDDALSVEILKADGPIHSRQRLWIHIADPTRYIELGSPLGQEARRRATSIYLPTETIPMFPMSLAAGPLSLRPGEVSCALSIGIMLDEAGGIDEDTPPVITPSYVKTTRLTYDQVDLLLDPFAMVNNESSDNNSGSSEENTIEDMETTVEILRQLQYASEQRLGWRVEGGSLESISPYELPDMTVKARPSPDGIDGWQVDIYASEQMAANRIVTELMLAANEAVALYGDTHGVPMPFRSQGMDELSDEEIEMTPEGPCRSWLAILSTSRSQISSKPLPHAGLGLDMYVQVTSPVRRYADLALHFQIKSHLRGDALPFPGNNDGEGNGGGTGIGETMVGIAQNAGTLSRQLERPANDYWLKEFLRRRGTQLTQVLVLSTDRWKDNVYKLLLLELGAICTYSSTKPLATGETLDMQCMHLSELV